MGCTMKTISPDVKKRIVDAVRQGYSKSLVAKMFGVSRKTVWRYCKQWRKRGRPTYRDKPRRPKHPRKKVTPEVERAIVVLRLEYRWGTQRIRENLAHPPPYIQHLLEQVTGKPWTPVVLSRQTINNVLKKHNLNGSLYKTKKDWKRFVASCPNELWQMDIRGPVLVDDKRVYILVIIDDYSRYLVWCEMYTSILSETASGVLYHIYSTTSRKPKKLLLDNAPQFREEFEKNCEKLGIVVVHTPPYYPQCKGKVERVIRTLNEEYLPLGSVFYDHAALLPEFRDWYNNQRYHMGIRGIPAQRYDVTDVG